MTAKLCLQLLGDGQYETPDGRYQVQQPHGMDPDDADRQWYVVSDRTADGPFGTLKEATAWLATNKGKRRLIVAKAELDTILAALRFWQQMSWVNHKVELQDIATNMGEHEPLTATEIDDLCERLNSVSA